MCSGTIICPPMSYMPIVYGSLNVNSTVWSSVASTDARKGATTAPPLPGIASFSRNRLNVKATSFAVNGVPSDHCTPSRVVNVRTVLSSLNDQSVASQGTISPDRVW